MSNPKKFRIFTDFTLYLRIINAYDAKNVGHRDWRQNVRSAFYVFLATATFISFPVTIGLDLWHLAEENAGFKACAIEFPIMMTLVQSLFIFISLLMNKRMLFETINQVQRAVNQRCSESMESREIYDRVEAKLSQITGIAEKQLIGMFTALFMLSAMFPISYAIFGYPAPEKWTLAFAAHSLLGRTNYVGFFVDLIIESASIGACFIVVIASAASYVGFVLYINGMVDDMETRLDLVDKKSSTATQMEIWSIYKQEIDFHLEIFGIASALNAMMKAILFNITFTCTISIAFDLYVFELDEATTFQAFTALVNLFTVVALTFAYFFFSEWLTWDLLRIGDFFYGSAWYRLTIKYQQLLIIPIMRAQREYRLSGIGLFYCSLPIFAKIIKTAASYFIMMRRFK